MAIPSYIYQLLQEEREVLSETLVEYQAELVDLRNRQTKLQHEIDSLRERCQGLDAFLSPQIVADGRQ